MLMLYVMIYLGSSRLRMKIIRVCLGILAGILFLGLIVILYTLKTKKRKKKELREQELITREGPIYIDYIVEIIVGQTESTVFSFTQFSHLYSRIIWRQFEAFTHS